MSSLTRLERYAELIQSMIPIPFVFPAKLGNSRPVYQPLLVYSRLLGGQTEDIRASLEALDDSVWSSLAFHLAGELLNEPEWIERSSHAFTKLISQQQPSGAFLPPDANANPERRWYEELILLHALASYAVRVGDPAIQNAVARSTQFHLNEIQPDHATAEPWGLMAFVQYAPPLADQVLHAMAMQYPQGITGVPLLLLVDVLYGLRQLITDQTHDQ